MSAVLAKTTEVYAKKADERLKTVRLFRRNACMKHGLPYEEDTDEGSAQSESTELGIISGVVDKLVDKVGARDGKDGRDGKDADPKVVADLVTKGLADLIPKTTGTTAAETCPPKGKGMGDIAKFAIASAVGAGLFAAPNYYFSQGNDKPAPPAPPPPIVQPVDKSGSILQYLEDEGFHNAN